MKRYTDHIELYNSGNEFKSVYLIRMVGFFFIFYAKYERHIDHNQIGEKNIELYYTQVK